jgi:hypothetical protein
MNQWLWTIIALYSQPDRIIIIWFCASAFESMPRCGICWNRNCCIAPLRQPAEVPVLQCHWSWAINLWNLRIEASELKINIPDLSCGLLGPGRVEEPSLEFPHSL